MAGKGVNNNLTPFGTIDKEREHELHVLGGKARGEQRRQRKTMKEWAEIFGELPVSITGPDGSTQQTNTMGNIVAAQMAKATKGDTKAARFIAELLGDLNKDINVVNKGPLVVTEKEMEALRKWATSED